ncbi:hypothetical protein OIU34_27860 [Pararhizobium sp. BT-229]|uniref:hypothetical protein n=1 Tax=Pararhizobium sp. BT-229 TaxID=2986923 RepID=UPI0021F765E8|nr:hypothetical protein [Pararhizobium sp. BT-229]MCV9965694.1 hypothetical protein [Pararhizobium sp. BT-229]
MKKKAISEETQSLVAHALLYKFDQELEGASLGYRPTVTAVAELCRAIKECGIPSNALAGAYFVNMGLHDNTARKDEFDAELQKSVGDEYAMGFLFELARLEKLRQEHWSSV